MTKNRTPTPVYLDPGMHPGLEVKGLNIKNNHHLHKHELMLQTVIINDYWLIITNLCLSLC